MLGGASRFSRQQSQALHQRVRLGAMDWERGSGTTNWNLRDGDGGPVRHIVIRRPRSGEPDGMKYVVSGPGHEESIHQFLDEARIAAEASLR